MSRDDFSQLDDAFITLWSRYILTANESIIDKDLELLAEMGQVDAVQKWYHFHNVGENEKIDALVQEWETSPIDSLPFNKVYALGNYHLRNQEEIRQNSKWVAELTEKFNELDSITNSYEEYKKCLAQIYILIRDLKDLPFRNYHNKACRLAISMAENTKDPIIAETMCEYKYTSINEYNGFDHILNNAMDNLIKDIKINIIQLYREYKMLKNPLKDNPQLCYALSRILTNFNMPMSDKKKKFGFSIMEQLANRDLELSIEQDITLRN